MWDNTDKKNLAYDDDGTDFVFATIGAVVVVILTFLGWMLW